LSTMSTSARVSSQSPSASIHSRQSSRLYGGILKGSAAMVRGVGDGELVVGDSLGAVGLWLPQFAARSATSKTAMERRMEPVRLSDLGGELTDAPAPRSLDRSWTVASQTVAISVRLAG